MNNIEIININSKSYYLCTDIFPSNPIFSTCKGRDVIKKCKLKEADYIYAYSIKSGWKISNEDYSKAKVLINVEWYNQKIHSLNKLTSNISSELTSNISIEYPIAPDILDIDDDEKFKDSNGNAIDIVIRGSREYKNCYFRVKDVSKCFDMPRLQDIIIDHNTSYELNKHYRFFTIIMPNNIGIVDSKNELYLTYTGILKVLFSSRSGNAESFQEWATEKLFTIQLGTEDSKYELVKSMFGGASIHAIKEAFKTSSGKTPCVYLFALGYANKLLNTEEYSDDCILYKFGNTDDLPRRSSEHDRNYKKQFKLDHIELMLFSVIDPKYIVDAETSIKDYFKLNIIKHENSKELIVLNKTEYDKTIKHYKLIQNSYIGCYKEMQDKINQLEQRLKEEQYKHELTRKDYENYQSLSIEKYQCLLRDKDKDIELMIQKLELETLRRDKEIEILNLKLKIAEHGLK